MQAEIGELVTGRIEEVRDSHIRVRIYGIRFLLAGVPIWPTRTSCSQRPQPRW